ncbi:tyrosine-type recombinase/integrase [Haloglycomyces albus]|uniref:tyrosine-type recombinase/integrase n=1 Tax=Haloglycomyces albus TaxID=526067 RepID=UPI00046CBE33|nr:site-specific integrase [Haloglycomyces albus]
MGYVIPRKRRSGTRYTAMYYDANGKARSAGTYQDKREAERKWHAAETKVDEGRGDHLVRGRQTFQEYAENYWLPNLQVEAKTYEGYHCTLYAYLMDFFGSNKMLHIRANDVRRWLKELKDQGMKPSYRMHCKILLSTIMNSAVKDDVIVGNPCSKVTMGKVEPQPIPVITPEQFELFHTNLPDAQSRLLVETAIETGLRWGELTEIRPKDINFGPRLLTVSRAVVQVSPRFHPEGNRFLVKDKPKSGKSRRFKIAMSLCNKLLDFITEHEIGQNDLIFQYHEIPTKPKTKLSAPKGKTEPNEKGRTYSHGTLSAYTAGRCRCDHCRRAMADYRAKRRANGKDQPREPRTWDTDGHIPNRWFRDNVIKPTLKKAELKVDIRMHMLRHAHASWLLNGGADLQVVKERLGHSSITTTERYLGTLDNADETALDALESVRYRSSSAVSTPEPAPDHLHSNQEPTTPDEILKQMTKLQAKLATMFPQQKY